MIRRTVKTARRALGSVAVRAAKILGMDAGLYHGISGRSLAGAASGVTVTSDSALKVSAYKRGVELIANYCGKTPFHVKQNNAKAKKHPAWRLVRKWAQYHQLSAFEFRRCLVLLALTRGNGYGYIARDPASMFPTELRILDPSRVDPVLRGGRLWYRFDGREKLIPATDVIHIRGVSLNGFVGLDPIRSYAVDVLGLSLAQTQYASTYYAAGGSPSVYVHSEVPLDDDKFNRLKAETGPLKRSLDNPHEIPVLDAAELKSITLSAEQTQLVESREFTLKDIANILNMSVHKLNGEGTGGYKSVEEENRAFRDDTLDPWFVQFEIEFEKLLTEDEQAAETYSVEAVRESLTRTNMLDRANYLNKAIGGPWMTQAEGREVDSLEAIDGSDQLLKPLNMVPKLAEDNGVGEKKAAGRSGEARDVLRQVAALEDVLARMAKRLTVASRKAAERSAGFPDFLAELPGRHADVIRSALAPVVELCGGDSAQCDAIGRGLLAQLRHDLQKAYDTATAEEFGGRVNELCDHFEKQVGSFARKAVQLWT